MAGTGKSTEELLNLDLDDFLKLSSTDLRRVVTRLASSANKRLRRFEGAGVISPAYRKVEHSGGSFSVAGKGLNELRAEYSRVKQFLQSSTGSVRGWKKVRKTTIDSLRKEGIEISPQDFDTLWKMYERLKEIDPGVSESRLKYTVLSAASTMISNGYDAETIVNRLSSQINDIYEELEQNEHGADGVSEFFEW